MFKFTWRKWVVVSTLTIVAGVGVFICLRGTDVISSEDGYVVEFLLKEGDEIYEVRSYDTTRDSRLFYNGNIAEVLSPTSHVSSPILSLPEVESSTDTLLSKVQVSDLTWESSLEESSEYLNYLESMGFSTIREVFTSQFVEKILELDGVKRRVIIFSSTIMVGDLYDDAELPEIEEYLGKYKS